VVAATVEKANTYVFAEMVIHNPMVGGSIPPPATNKNQSFIGQLNWPLVVCGRIAHRPMCNSTVGSGSV
jgi:hypothetical protein